MNKVQRTSLGMALVVMLIFITPSGDLMTATEWIFFILGLIAISIFQSGE